MQSDLLASLRRLSDDELVARVKDLVAGERGGMVLVVAHLAELDTRDVHYRLGHGSLFAYCRDVLGLSEQEAYNRIAVARAARRYPVILLQMLEDGSAQPHHGSAARPSPDARQPRRPCSRRRAASPRSQVEELAAALWPRPDVPSFVRKLPAPRPVAASMRLGQLRHPRPHQRAASTRPIDGFWLRSRQRVAAVLPGAARLRLSAEARDPPRLLRRPFLALAPARRRAHSESACLTDCPDRPLPHHRCRSIARRPASTRAAEVTPLSPDRYKVQVTIGRRDAREAAAREGPAAPRGAVGRRGRHPGSRAHGAAGGPGSEESSRRRKGRARRAAPRPGSRSDTRPRSSAASGSATWGAARSWRRPADAAAERAFLEFHHLRALRARRRGHAREHPAALSEPQRVRGAVVVRGRQRKRRRRGGAGESCDVRRSAHNSFRNELPLQGASRAGAMTSPRVERDRVDRSARWRDDVLRQTA